MRIDADIQSAVVTELHWEPRVNAAEIGVTVTGGIVTLQGIVSSTSERHTAIEAAKRVAGVIGIADELVLATPDVAPPTDVDLVRAAVRALQEDARVPAEHISITVRAGVLTLDGRVQWPAEKMAAEEIVRGLPGVTDVISLIDAAPNLTTRDIAQRISETFRQHAAIDADHILADADDGIITLRGTAHTMHEREEAERLAWAMPGVIRVNNLIEITPE